MCLWQIRVVIRVVTRVVIRVVIRVAVYCVGQGRDCRDVDIYSLDHVAE